MSGAKFGPMAILAAILFLVALATAAAAPPHQKEQPANLFGDAGGVGVQAVPPDRGVVRSRPVTINLGQLGGPGGGVSVSSTPEVNDVIRLNLFDDVSYTARLDAIEPLTTGGYAWIGRLENQPLSQVVFVVNQGQTAGNIATPDGFFGVRYLSGDTHAVVQIDQSAYPGDNPIPVDVPDVAPPIQAAADDGSQIDVLVAYTAIARQAAGGATAIQNLINLAVTETNQSYANSGINHRLNLVHTEEVSYAESGNLDTDLDRLRATTDGYMDNLHALRNTHNADLVTLMVESGGAYCGLAYLMTSVSTAFESSGFSIIVRDCATGYYSFGHEIGHNMGARHDWYVDPGTTPYSYAHGYVNTTARWRTVMAYNTLCSASGFNCTRLPYWSNPNLSYNGAPLGVPVGSSQPADNHQTLNNTAYTVANFRQGSSPPAATGPLVYSSHAVNDDNTGDSSGNSNGIAECGEVIETGVWLYNQGATTATGVNATISTSSPYITFPFNTSSAYPDISGGGTQANSNDFDMAIDAATPDGTAILFNLTITAGNGGPWSASFVLPVSCNPTSGDSFEPDNSSGQAKTITSGVPQSHSIYPVGDQDWVKFTLATSAAVTVETAGSPGDDTRLWLYDSTGTSVIAYNDDINLLDGNFFSRITRSCAAGMLSSGTYTVKVDEYLNNDIIGAYDLSLTVNSCVDAYEPDNTVAQAKTISPGAPQQHSIVPVGDVDWVQFTLSAPSEVVLTTSGISGDTRLYLYDSSGTILIAENDDINGAANRFSAIFRCNAQALPAGTYTVKVDEYNNNDEIGGYTLTFSDQCLDIFLPVVFK